MGSKNGAPGKPGATSPSAHTVANVPSPQVATETYMSSWVSHSDSSRHPSPSVSLNQLVQYWTNDPGHTSSSSSSSEMRRRPRAAVVIAGVVVVPGGAVVVVRPEGAGDHAPPEGVATIRPRRIMFIFMALSKPNRSLPVGGDLKPRSRRAGRIERPRACGCTHASSRTIPEGLLSLALSRYSPSNVEGPNLALQQALEVTAIVPYAKRSSAQEKLSV